MFEFALSRRVIESRPFYRGCLSNRLQDVTLLDSVCAVSLDTLLLNRFSLSPFPLLDDPQPRKTSGKDNHDDQNGILYHWSALG